MKSTSRGVITALILLGIFYLCGNLPGQLFEG